MSKEELKPYGTRLLVKRTEVSKQTAGGLYLPNQEAEKHNEGTVVTAGPECSLVNVGDKVIFMPFAGFEIEIAGRKYIVLPEEDVMGKLTPIT